jgi:hypothetical protein
MQFRAYQRWFILCFVVMAIFPTMDIVQNFSNFVYVKNKIFPSLSLKVTA